MSLLRHHQLLMSSAAVVPAPESSLVGAYTWWISPNTVTLAGNLYTGGVDQDGTYVVTQTSPGGSQVAFPLASFEGDDHNAAVFNRRSDGKILAVYTRHNVDNLIRMRVSSSADDVSAWDTEYTLVCSAAVTYSQIWSDNGRTHLFFRIAGTGWGHRYSDDDGVSWSAEKIIFTSNDHMYMSTVPDPADSSMLRLLVVGHPIMASNQNIYYGLIDLDTGSITHPGSSEFANLYSGIATAEVTDFELVTAVSGTGFARSRALSIGWGANPQIAYALFNDENDAVYRIANRSDGTWSHSANIVAAGMPVENPVGDNYYFGGVALGPSNSIAYVARESEQDWLLERYTESGGIWSLDSTLISSDWELRNKVMRPTVPYGTFPGVPIVAMYGKYETFGHGGATPRHRTQVILNPSLIPAFSETVIFGENYSGFAPGATPTDHAILAASGTVTASSITAQDGGYFGRRHVRMSITGSNTAIWQVSNTAAADVKVRADFAPVSSRIENIGLTARWVDSDNRVQLRTIYRTSVTELRIRQRLGGVDTYTSVDFALTRADFISLELILVGTEATANAYDASGELVATVTRTVEVTSAGKFGMYFECDSSATVDVSKYLVTVP